jgi:hypothetical protein
MLCSDRATAITKPSSSTACGEVHVASRLGARVGAWQRMAWTMSSGAPRSRRWLRLSDDRPARIHFEIEVVEGRRRPRLFVVALAWVGLHGGLDCEACLVRPRSGVFAKNVPGFGSVHGPFPGFMGLMIRVRGSKGSKGSRDNGRVSRASN